MLSIFDSFILGVIQGLTEWFPISSSGHLVVYQQLSGIDVPVAFDVMLHFATLVVILFVFRKDIISILRSVAKGDFKSPEGKLVLFILAGTIPTALMGFFFYDFFTSLFTNLLSVGISLIVTGMVLFTSKFVPARGEINYRKSLLIGTAQGISLIPGMSRSGLTIGTGILSGISRETAVRYSFLLSIPAILGATLFEFNNLTVSGVDAVSLAIGMLTAMIVGYFSLKTLISLVLKGRFHLFAFYCWIVGVIIILISMV